MNNFSFLPPPFYPYQPYRKYNPNFRNSKVLDKENIAHKTENENTIINIEKKEKSPRYSKNSLPFNFNIDSFFNPEEPILELMGIKLYLDDIIILCLLFLLYKEDVKDESLFISLIILLLS